MDIKLESWNSQSLFYMHKNTENYNFFTDIQVSMLPFCVVLISFQFNLQLKA